MQPIHSNIAQHSVTQPNTIQHNPIQAMQSNITILTQHNTTQPNTAQPSAAQYNTAQWN